MSADEARVRLVLEAIQNREIAAKANYNAAVFEKAVEEGDDETVFALVKMLDSIDAEGKPS